MPEKGFTTPCCTSSGAQLPTPQPVKTMEPQRGREGEWNRKGAKEAKEKHWKTNLRQPRQ